MAVDTIFALASGRPPAAIGIIRISGPHAHKAGNRIAGDLPSPRETALRLFFDPNNGELIDRGLLLRFDAPASATGEDIIEFHIHGGRAVADAMLVALGSLSGLRLAEPGEFTRRAFDNGRIDLTEAEGLADLLEAETESQRRAALAIAGGGLRRQIESWRQRLLDLSGRAEAAIDYDEEDSADLVQPLSCDCNALALELSEWLDRPGIEPLRNGVRVVIAGPPNSGKSSLLNVITGSDRAIVTDIPGTTRDHLEASIAIEGIPILLTDTAGLRHSDDPVEKLGVTRSRDLIEAAEILIWLGDADQSPRHPRLILVHSRCDRADRENGPSGALPVSSLTGKGVKELLNQIAKYARTLLPGEGQLALNRRQATHIEAARNALRIAESQDLVLLAEGLRSARLAFDRLIGKADIEDVLDALFSRFCLGK